MVIRADFQRRWAIASAAGAAVVSACDALLLERSKGYFTGGFLSVDYLRGAGDTAAFLFVSLLVDAAFIGLVTALAAWALSRTRLHARAAILAGALAATGALLASDLASYGILRYLGDSFDFALMVDLAGGSVAELLAVASSHLVGPALLAAGAAGAGVGLVWVAHRSAGGAVGTPPGRAALAVPLLFAVLGATTLAAAAAASDTLENGLLRKPAGRMFASFINAVTDVDGDGYGVVGRLSDPDPLDGSVFPYAVDVPGNGVDEDRVGGDLPAGAADAPAEPALPDARWAHRPDVILFVLESFRADVVGIRVRGTAVTPVMDGLAARGLSLAAAYSHNGYTVQSRHHLLSGRLTGAPGAGTLIDDFKANGYLVGYFSGQDESFGSQRYDVGFTRADVAHDARSDRARRYSTSSTPGSLAVPHAVIDERIGEFLESRGAEPKPLFLYVNFHDTHFPYTHDGIETLTSASRLPRERIAPAERAALWETYTNTAANVDRAIGAVLDRVRQTRGGEPGVIVTADHGESLFDNGFLGHGYALNDAQTRIPLIVANLPLEVAAPFGQIDLRPAIAAALSGTSTAGAAPAARVVAGRALFQYLGELARPRQIALLRNGRRIIYDFRSRRVQIAGGTWLPQEQLAEHERTEFLALVHRWERLKAAAP